MLLRTVTSCAHSIRATPWPGCGANQLRSTMRSLTFSLLCAFSGPTVTVQSTPAPPVNLLSDITICSVKPVGDTSNTAAWSLTMCFAGAGLLISLWLITPLTMFGVRRMCSEARRVAEHVAHQREALRADVEVVAAAAADDGADGGIHHRELVPEPMLAAVVVEDERRELHAEVHVVDVQRAAAVTWSIPPSAWTPLVWEPELPLISRSMMRQSLMPGVLPLESWIAVVVSGDVHPRRGAAAEGADQAGAVEADVGVGVGDERIAAPEQDALAAGDVVVDRGVEVRCSPAPRRPPGSRPTRRPAASCLRRAYWPQIPCPGR